jgi:hypothetical protein
MGSRFCVSSLGGWHPGRSRLAISQAGRAPSRPSGRQACTRASHDEAARGSVTRALQQEVARWEAAMRAPVGSPKWRSYWREGGGVRYRAALEAVEAADAPPAVARQRRSRQVERTCVLGKYIKTNCANAAFDAVEPNGS